MVIALCTSSDRGFYLYLVSRKFLVSEYGADTNDGALTDGYTYVQTYRQTDGTDTKKFGEYNIIPHHSLWRDIKIQDNPDLKRMPNRESFIHLSKYISDQNKNACSRIFLFLELDQILYTVYFRFAKLLWNLAASSNPRKIKSAKYYHIWFKLYFFRITSNMNIQYTLMT